MVILIKLVQLFTLEVVFLIFNLIFIFFILETQYLPNWNKQMQNLCTQVNFVIEKIQQSEPEWSRVALASQINSI